MTSDKPFLFLSSNISVYDMGMVTSPVPLGCSEGQMRQGEPGTVLDLWTLETKLLFLTVLLN